MNSVYTLLTQLVNQLFPPSPDAHIVETLREAEMMSLYAHTLIDGVSTLSMYKDARIRALIHEAKFHRNGKAFAHLSLLFSQYCVTSPHPIDIIVPVPLSGLRLRARGYNQVHEVLKKATLPTSATIHSSIVVRKVHTRPQTELARSKRLVNVRDAFGVAHASAHLISGKHIMLVDDVMTTGATLRAAKATLLPYSPASVTCVALAH